MPAKEIVFRIEHIPEPLKPRAITFRDYLLYPKLKNLSCSTCEQEVVIEIKEAGNYFEPVIHKCCDEFEKQIRTRLGFKT